MKLYRTTASPKKTLRQMQSLVRQLRKTTGALTATLPLFQVRAGDTTLLKEIYFGNFYADKHIQNDHIRAMTTSIVEQEKRLRALLSKEADAEYCRLVTLTTNRNAEQEDQAFLFGYRMAVQMIFAGLPAQSALAGRKAGRHG